MAEKNYYLILGVSPETSGDQIRSAYRRLAKKHHPDKTGGNRTAYFQEIAEAYETLSDPAKRGSYNRKLEEEREIRKRNAGRAPGFAENSRRTRRSEEDPKFSRENVFEDFFDHSFSGEDIFRKRDRSFRSAGVLEMDAYLTPEEALRGGSVEVNIPVPKPCPECRGTGKIWVFDCPLCEGAGEYETGEKAGIEFPPGIRSDAILYATFPLKREKYLQLLIHVHIMHL